MPADLACHPSRAHVAGVPTNAGKTLLVATDFSQTADHALGVAMDLARALDARIELLHVVPAFKPPQTEPLASTIPLAYMPEIDRDLEHRARLARARHIECATACVTGSASEQIVERAAHTGASLIVLGTHGKGFRGLLTGNTARTVTRTADRSVLVVPPAK